MTNILLIEDNDVDRFIVEKVFKLADVEVNLTTRTNGRDGLDILVRQFLDTGHLPDMILIDRFMPEMDGIKFIEAFANLDMKGKEHVRVYMLTNSIDPAILNQHTRANFTAVIQKPFTREILSSITSGSHQILPHDDVARGVDGI